jgi:hypothetical protein
MLIRETSCFEWKKAKNHPAPASLMTKTKDVFASKSNSQGPVQKDISLEMKRDRFRVSALRGETEYSSCFTLREKYPLYSNQWDPNIGLEKSLKFFTPNRFINYKKCLKR